MKNYVDIKMMVWHRLHFTEEATMKEISDIIKEDGLDEVIDEKVGFVESEVLFDTEERLEVSDNDNEATIEVYQDRNEMWNNNAA